MEYFDVGFFWMFISPHFLSKLILVMVHICGIILIGNDISYSKSSTLVSDVPHVSDFTRRNMLTNE